jgi:hypothetical protein
VALVRKPLVGISAVGYDQNDVLDPDKTLGQAIEGWQSFWFSVDRIPAPRLREPVRIEMQLSDLLTWSEFLDKVNHTIQAIDLVYSGLAIANYGPRVAAKFHANYQRVERIDLASVLSACHQVIQSEEIGLLRVASIHYGSPASFDFLGIGKILEIVRDTIKDLLWRGKHEKQMAELERERTAEEIQSIRLATEKALFELADQKLTFVEKLASTQLVNVDKDILMAVMLQGLTQISDSKLTLPSGDKTKSSSTLQPQ